MDIAFLIANGHREGDIGGYPLDTFRAYVTLALRVSARHRRDYITDTASAIAGALSGHKAIAAYVKTLEDTITHRG